MLTFQVETLAATKDEALPLLRAHWEEIALDKDSVPLDPDWAMYERLEAGGCFHVVTARDGGRLVGYSAYFLAGNLHYRSLFIAESDIFYLAKEYRGARAGMRLLQFAEESLKGKGVNKIVTRTKLHSDHGPLLEHLGYKPIERIYWKSLAGG